MRIRLVTLVALVFAGAVLPELVCAAGAPAQGEWILYRVMRADEWTPTAVDYITIVAGERVRQGASEAQWWQMIAAKPGGRGFAVQGLSDRVPMSTGDGDIGTVYRYIFRQEGRPALEYVNKLSGLAHLPMFGFRDGLIPTTRSRMNMIGGFYGTGSYIGQPVSAQGHGQSGKWQDLGLAKKLILDDDVMVGTVRWVRDDGSGPGPDKEYKYVEFSAEDYDRMFEAGFNFFIVNNAHAAYVREKDAFFVKPVWGKNDPYPEILYRSNYYGPTYYVDEPASRMNALDCRTVYDAVNLLRHRDRTYFHAQGYEADRIVRMIQQAGFGVGTWYPRQSHIFAWDTYVDTLFYQVQEGGAAAAPEGRYNLKEANDTLRLSLGDGAEMTVPEMLRANYASLRGAARCFDKDWGTAIYGQCDPAIAPDALTLAYDMGARFYWFWTTDHDHHVPFTRQLELARTIRSWQKEHPRAGRHILNRRARTAVAAPEGYIGPGVNMWWAGRFKGYHYNEFGVPYIDVNSEIVWQLLRLGKLGVDYDYVVDYPEVINKAGYGTIIRISPDATTSLPNPKMPSDGPAVSIEHTGRADEFLPPRNTPKAMAQYADRGKVKVDADLSEWKGASWTGLDTKTVYDNPDKQWSGRDDLSARAAFAYDEDSLYVAVEVTDDVMCADFDGFDIWKNDCVQLGLDPLCNPNQEGFYEFDDSELGFSLIGGRPYSRIWEQQVSGAVGDFPGAETAVVRSGNVTRYELRVPFSAVRPLTPSYPGYCRMNIVVDDSDGGFVRKGAICWSEGLVGGKNPNTWGVLEFAGPEKLANPVPAAYLKAEKTAVRPGEDALFKLETGSWAAADAELVVTAWHGNVKTDPRPTRLKVQPGMNRYRVRVDTRGLGSDSYRAEFVLMVGGKPAVRQIIRFYVLP